MRPGVARLFVFGLAAVFRFNDVLLIIGAYSIAKVIVAVLLLEPLLVFPFRIFVFLYERFAPLLAATRIRPPLHVAVTVQTRS